MSSTRCPTCGRNMEQWQPGSYRCPSCDSDSVSSERRAATPPTIPHAIPSRAPNARQPDIRLLAEAQRWLLWLILGSVVANILIMKFGSSMPGIVGIIVPIIYLGVLIAVVVGAGIIMHAMRWNIALLILLCFMLLAPCIQLLVLLLVNSSTTRMLRQHGLRVGFMGVAQEDIERVLNPMLCTNCSYNLTGNTTGICPECGSVVERRSY